MTSVHIPCKFLDRDRVTLSPHPETDECFVIFGRDRDVRHVEIVSLSEFLAAVARMQEGTDQGGSAQ